MNITMMVPKKHFHNTMMGLFELITTTNASRFKGFPPQSLLITGVFAKDPFAFSLVKTHKVIEVEIARVPEDRVSEFTAKVWHRSFQRWVIKSSEVSS